MDLISDVLSINYKYNFALPVCVSPGKPCVLERKNRRLPIYINYLAYPSPPAVSPFGMMSLILERLASQQFVAHLFPSAPLPIKPIRFPPRPIPARPVSAQTHAISDQTHPLRRPCRGLHRKAGLSMALQRRTCRRAAWYRTKKYWY